MRIQVPFKCLFCNKELNSDLKHYHWYLDSFSNNYIYAYTYLNIRDIVVCDYCFQYVKDEDIKIPKYIPKSQREMYVIKYLRRQYENTGTKMSSM